ncbi:SDR family NAD(P)-dependent oxidoreductase [soil metagenome]
MISDGVAIVTGGSLGIGLAAVQALAGRGMTVVSMARDSARNEASVAPLGGKAVAMSGDVSTEADVKRVIAATVERLGRLDVVVNAAGGSMTARRRLADTDSAEWHRLIDINLTGTYLMCREALPHLEKSPDGYILNIQSTGAYVASAGNSLYQASKFGVRALSEALIDEYRNSSVRISSVSPGPVDTNIWNHKLKPPDARRRALMMRPADIADILVWLLDRPRRLHIPNITVTPWTGI